MSDFSRHGKLPGVILSIKHYYPDGGGAEVLAHRLAVELVKRGLPLEVLTGRYGRRQSMETMDGVPVRRHFIGAYVPVLHEICYLASFAWQLIVRRHQYDIVHVFQTQLSAFVVSIIGRWLGKRVVTTNHGAREFGDMAVWEDLPMGKRMLATVCDGADVATAVSSEVIAELVEAGFDRKKVVYIPNGVPLTASKGRDRTSCRRDLGLPPVGFVAVFVGRLAPEKAPEVLLDAWESILREPSSQKLLFVGDGQKRSDLENRIKTRRLGDSVLLSGRVDNVEDYLMAADVFVLPSVTEGMSLALLEAMGAGLPVVASRVSGTVDVIKDGENGLLFDSGDRHGLARCLNALMGSPRLRARLGRQARETVEKEFSFESMADRYYELYRSLL
jgi:glycosyltransferase involved in cell wall biosynthesis